MTTTTADPLAPNGSSSPLLSLKAHTGTCHVARYDANGRYILTGGADRTVKLWSANGGNGGGNGAPIKTYTSGHSYEILAIDVTLDNSRFASAGGDKNVVLWDVASSSILRRFSAHEGRINDVRFAAEGNVLVTGGFDATLRMYDLRAQGAWRPIMESKEASDAIQAVAVGAGDNAVIRTGSVDGVLRTYDVRQGQVTQDTIGEPIISISSPPDTPLALVSTTASTHRLMDTSDGSLLQTFTGHENTQYRCHSALSNRQDTVVAGDENGHLHTWDVLSGKRRSTRRGAHTKAVLWTECNPKVDGQVLTAGADGVVNVWQS